MQLEERKREEEAGEREVAAAAAARGFSWLGGGRGGLREL